MRGPKGPRAPNCLGFWLVQPIIFLATPALAQQQTDTGATTGYLIAQPIRIPQSTNTGAALGYLIAQPIQVPQPTNGNSSTGTTGVIARSSVGLAGQRQGVAQTTSRYSTRIANRVESRIRNRIDPYYNPQANTLSPFAVASENTGQ